MKGKKKKVANRVIKKKDDIKKNKILEKKDNNNSIFKGNINKYNNMVDVCTVLKECNIDEISKYLIEIGKKKGYPDISKK